MRKPRSAQGGRGTRAALAVGLAAALGMGVTVRAAGPEAFGMVGLGPSQSALLHAVLTGPTDPTHPGCKLTLSFVDARGQVFHDQAGNEVTKKLLLQDNVAMSLRLRASDVLAKGERRKLIRGVVTCPTELDAPFDCRSLIVTQELMSGDAPPFSFGFDRAQACPGDPIPPTPR